MSEACQRISCNGGRKAVKQLVLPESRRIQPWGSENKDEACKCSDERLDQRHERHQLSSAADWAGPANLERHKTSDASANSIQCHVGSERDAMVLCNSKSGLRGKHKPAVRYSLSRQFKAREHKRVQVS